MNHTLKEEIAWGRLLEKRKNVTTKSPIKKYKHISIEAHKGLFQNRDVNLKILILFYINNVVFHVSVRYLSEY